jgi:hypothetical protein
MYFECRALAFIPHNLEPDTDRESGAMTYTGVHCLDVIFKRGILTLSTMSDNLISTLEYIYSILGKEMDSKTATVTAPVNSLEAFLMRVVWQGEICRVYWRW